MRVRGRNEAAAFRALVLFATLAMGNVAKADPESVRIDYTAPAGCPDSAAFMRSLRQRTTRFREAGPDEQAREFLVRVTAQAASFSGRLAVRSVGGRTAIRDVDATICDEVSGALALITALAIDPNALRPGAKESSDSQSQPARVPAMGPVAVVSSPVAVAREPSPPWRWSAGLLGHTTFVVSPTLGYGGELFAEAEAPVSSRLGPAARVGIFLNQSDVTLPTGANARFQWALMQLEGCPLRLGGRVAIHPCFALRLGALHGEGRRISQPRQTVSLWSDAGPVLRVRFSVTARLLLEVEGGLVFPLHRPAFDILDTGVATTAYSVPRVGGSAAIGVAYRFR